MTGGAAAESASLARPTRAPHAHARSPRSRPPLRIPTELGFSEGSVCDNGVGSCPSLGDVGLCAAKLEYECGTGHTGPGIMSDCGTHATPIHMHEGAECEYDENDASGHSTLVGVILDGRGIYGRWEGAGLLARDMPFGANALDACNGHSGPVPATTINGVTYPAMANVYH